MSNVRILIGFYERSKSFLAKRRNPSTLLLGLTLSLSTSPLQASQYFDINDLDHAAFVSDAQIHAEEHSLMELIESDLRFFKQHPSNIMSSAQIIYSIIKSQNIEEINLPGYGLVPVYSIFSRTNQITDGRRIIGQYEGIKAVVDSIESQARGDKTGRTVPLLVGTHGTGKTEFRTIIEAALKNLTRSNSKYYMHEISWDVDSLRDIPDVDYHIKTCQTKEMRSPLHSSPVSILPKVIKDKIRQLSASIVQAEIGTFPVAEMDPDPLSKYIRDKILTYYLSSSDEYVTSHLNELGIEKLNNSFLPLDEVKILDQYMKIRRVILGEPGTVPKIDAQGDDIDYQGLIMSENPIFRMIEGPSGVWSWNYNGLVLSGSRNFIFLDEFFRNPIELRDMFLGIMESREVSRGGSPSVPIDSVIVAATNSVSLDHAKGDGKSDAQINRLRPIKFEWSVKPLEIAKTIMYMNGKGMRMSPLNGDSSSYSEDQFEAADLDALFPEPLIGTPIKTPDRRYKLVYGEGSDAVHISPHALMFMANFIAATRFNTNVAEAKALRQGQQIIEDPIFRDPLARLQVYNGELRLQSSQYKELYNLNKNLNEGSTGISARVVGRWFSEAIIEAKQDANNDTLTPSVLKTVYDRLANEGSLEIDSVETRLRWDAIMNQVIIGVLVPKFQADIYTSLYEDGRSEEIYQEIMSEIVILSQDDQAQTYERNGQSCQIDHKRLKKISDLYKEQTGRQLAYDQISRFYMNQISSNFKTVPDEDVIKAIHRYLAESLNALVSVKNLADFAERRNGSKEVSSKYRSLESTLINKLGYNKKSIAEALKIIKTFEQKSK